MYRTSQRDIRFAENELSLRELLVSGLAGDDAAYRDFLKALSAHLRAYFRKRLLQRMDEVEDLVQEVLIAVHNQRQTYQSDQPLTAWVHAIARYKLIDVLRAHSARGALNDPLDDELEIFAVSETDAADAKRDLGKLLSTLPDKQRLPIVHVKIEGLSVLEAAKLTGMSESAIKIGVHRGLKALGAKIRGIA
jgi:RNA polymerase sigma-70 factor (ECF subfamily)